MRRTASGFLVTALLLAGVVGGLWLTAAGRADKPTDVDKLNKKIDPFTLADAAGKPWSLAAVKDPRAVVVVFLSFDCPVSTSYSPTLAELHKAYAGKGVTFLGVNASDELTPAEVAKKATEYSLPFPVLMDSGAKVADLFKAKSVPEAFVLDHNLVLRYRGRVDNSYSARLKRNP